MIIPWNANTSWNLYIYSVFLKPSPFVNYKNLQLVNNFRNFLMRLLLLNIAIV